VISGTMALAILSIMLSLLSLPLHQSAPRFVLHCSGYEGGKMKKLSDDCDVILLVVFSVFTSLTLFSSRMRVWLTDIFFHLNISLEH